jgi:hypothetical protein
MIFAEKREKNIVIFPFLRVYNTILKWYYIGVPRGTERRVESDGNHGEKRNTGVARGGTDHR